MDIKMFNIWKFIGKFSYILVINRSVDIINLTSLILINRTRTNLRELLNFHTMSNRCNFTYYRTVFFNHFPLFMYFYDFLKSVCQNLTYWKHSAEKSFLKLYGIVLMHSYYRRLYTLGHTESMCLKLKHLEAIFL